MPASPLTTSADPDRLNQILSNLLYNALRYTPAGGNITLRAKHQDDYLLFTVKDDGEGIAQDDLPFVFDRFWQADKARAGRKHGNVGLGLAITKQLVEAHDGEIWVESVLGQGATFTIQLPA